jgi:hypothetical protein
MVPTSEPTSIPAHAAPEADFLAALAPGGLLKVAIGCLVGAAVGLMVGRAFLRQHESKAVFRTATIAFGGPVIPLNELKARAVSRDLITRALTNIGSTEPPEAYRVQADADDSRDPTVLTLVVSGPKGETSQALASAILEEFTRVTHEAYEREISDEQKRLRVASQAAESLTGISHENGAGTGVAAAAAVISIEKWVGELESSRTFLMRSVLDSRDSEIIDKPYVRENSSRILLLTALGGFAGMLIGLSLASRPRAAGAR